MKNMKKSLSLVLVLVLTLTLCLPIAYANDNSIKVLLNGEYVNFDVEPQLVNGRTMVPFRAIFEAMGAQVEWNQDLWQASGEKDGKKVSMIIDSNEVVVNNNGEEKIIEIDQAPILIDGRTMVPVRFVAQAFDKIVAWDNDERTVIIFDLQYFVDRLQEKAPNFYECLTSTYTIPETFKQNDEFKFEVNAQENDLKENGKLTLEGKMNTIMNQTDAYVGLDVEYEMYNQIFGDDEFETEKYDVTADIYIKDNGMLIKTNLLELMEEDEIQTSEKVYSVKKDGIYIDISKLGIPGVETFEDLMALATEISNTVIDLDQISNLINEAIYNQEISVQDAKLIVDLYDVMLTLVDDDKFVKEETGKKVEYIWTIDKQDIIDFMFELYKSGIVSQDDIDMEELKELNDIFKEFEMVTQITVEDNIPVKANIDFNLGIKEFETEGSIVLSWDEEITSVNKGPYKINHPDYEKGLDIFKYIEEQEAMYEEAEKQWELSWMQDSVTIYIMEEVMNSDGTKTVEQVVAQLYTENGWASDAKEKLNLDEKIDLNKYRLTSAGTVEVK